MQQPTPEQIVQMQCLKDRMTEIALKSALTVDQLHPYWRWIGELAAALELKDRVLYLPVEDLIRYCKESLDGEA